MQHPCHHQCSFVFDSDEERSRHERTCPHLPVSCCQSSQSCRRKVNEWIDHKSVRMVPCRHGSNGLFGAIKEDNLDLVQHFLQELKYDLVNVLTHESKFGDTILTFSCSLGRSKIVEVLVKAIACCVKRQIHNLATSDLLDYETSRGKIPIIEAVKSNNTGVVKDLLAHQANANKLSKTHKRSALDWAIALGNESIIRVINEHVSLEEHACLLFNAVSKSEMTKVKSLTEGGIPFQRNQDSALQNELKSKRYLVRLAKQNLDETALALQQAEQDKARAHSEINRREKHIESLFKRREDIVSSRRKEVTQVTAKVRLAITAANITHMCNMTNPPLEYELVSKALCHLMHIKVKKPDHRNEETLEKGQPNMIYWSEIKSVLQDSSRFFHRIRHYHFQEKSVEVAGQLKIEGLTGTCSDHLYSILDNNNGSILLTSIIHWLQTIFQSSSGHKLENDLVMQEGTEKTALERNIIDHDVLTSRSAILKRELDSIAFDLASNTKRINELQRILEVGTVLKFVDGGHSILSWAAGVGNEDIVRLLLKRGAHTALGEDALLTWCTTIIQVVFRNSLERRGFYGNDHNIKSMQARNERRKREFATSLRVKSLSNLIRERLKSVRLPFAEAVVNGHSKVALILDGSDIPLFQAINLFPLFCPPSAAFPRSSCNAEMEVWNEPIPSESSALLSSVTLAGRKYHHEQDPRKCALVDSLKSTIELYDAFLKQRKDRMEEKVSKRRETLYNRHRNAMASNMRSAIYTGDFAKIVQASEEGGISMDFEDSTTGMTPLIRAAMEDVHSPLHVWCENSMGEQVTAVAYLLDRISRHRPSVDNENKSGHTALAMACMHGRLEVIQDLIDRGADIKRQSSLLNCSSYDLAVSENQLAVVEFLDKLRDPK